MSKLILFLSLIFADKVFSQTTSDWSTLTINKGCTVNKKFCNSELRVDHEGRTSFIRCGQKTKNVSIDKNLLDKVKTINKKQLIFWRENTSIDTVCGYLIKLDNSDNEYVTLDINPDMYDQTDIKDFIVTLNEIYKRLD